MNGGQGTQFLAESKGGVFGEVRSRVPQKSYPSKQNAVLRLNAVRRVLREAQKQKNKKIDKI